MHKLKYFREKANLSQAQLAKSAGIAVNSYQRYEYGEREPKISTVIRIANALGITIDELCGQTNSRHIECL